MADARVQDGEQEGREDERHHQVVHQDERPEHGEGMEAERLEPPADDRGAEGGGEGDHEDETDPRPDAARHRLGVAHRLPHEVGHEAIEEVRPEAEEVPRPEPPEEVPDQVAEGRAPGRRRPEEEGADDRDRVGRPELGDAGDEGHHLERDQDGRIERRADGRQDDHPGIAPHGEQLPHFFCCPATAAALYSPLR